MEPDWGPEWDHGGLDENLSVSLDENLDGNLYGGTVDQILGDPRDTLSVNVKCKI